MSQKLSVRDVLSVYGVPSVKKLFSAFFAIIFVINLMTKMVYL